MGVGEVGFVRPLFDPGHVPGVGQIHRPPGPFDQFIRQISRPGAGLNGHPFHRTEPFDVGHDSWPIVGTTLVSQNRAVRVHYAHLNRILVIVQSHENRYTRHARCSKKRTSIALLVGYTSRSNGLSSLSCVAMRSGTRTCPRKRGACHPIGSWSYSSNNADRSTSLQNQVHQRPMVSHMAKGRVA